MHCWGVVIPWDQCSFGCCITLDLGLLTRVSRENSLEVSVSAQSAALRHGEVMVIDTSEVEVWDLVFKIIGFKIVEQCLLCLGYICFNWDRYLQPGYPGPLYLLFVKICIERISKNLVLAVECMPKWPLDCHNCVFAGRGRRSANRDRQMMSSLYGRLPGIFRIFGDDLGNCFALPTVAVVVWNFSYLWLRPVILPLILGHASRPPTILSSPNNFFTGMTW